MIDYFFSFKGRIPRKHYWISTLVIISLAILAFAIGFGLLELGIGMVAAFALPAILFAVIVVASFSIGLRRLHDRNKGWRWLIPFYILPTILDAERLGLAANSLLFWVVTAIGLGLSIWALVDLGFLRGTDGPNEYGEDPLNPMPTADVFE